MEKKSVVYGPQPRTAAFGLVLGYSRPPFQGLALCGSRCNRKFEVLSLTHCFVSISGVVNPEEKARQQIDAMLVASGWAVQTKDTINLSAQQGVAICELSFATGEPDYTLFVDGKAIGTVEAKPEGVTLTSVEEQSAKYVAGVPFGLPAWKSPLAFCYESTGAETFFTNRLDPQPPAAGCSHFIARKRCSPGCSRRNSLPSDCRNFRP